MNRLSLPLSPYLQQLIKENLLLPREVEAVARLPEALQEKAVEASESLRGPAMDKVVSNLLNPGRSGAPRKFSLLSWVISLVILGLIAAVLISGTQDVALFVRYVSINLAAAVRDKVRMEKTFLALANAPVDVPPPAPILSASWYEGRRSVLLSWKTVGQGCTYRIYRSYGNRRDVPLNEMGLYNDGPWTATRAIVTAGFDGEKDTLLGVVAISADGRQVSPLSNTIRMDLDPRYRKDSITSVPLEHPQPESDFHRLPQGREDGAPPAPRFLLAQNITSKTLELLWRAVGPHVHYKLYLSLSGKPDEWVKSVLPLLDTNGITITPRPDFKHFWVAVTTLDPADRESAASAPLQIDIPSGPP